jgi:hypothetical protein
MKALKSQLASDLLADPKARGQLRQFITREWSASHAGPHATSGEFRIRLEDGQLVRATIVPKAKAA